MILLNGKSLSEKILSSLKSKDLSKLSLHIILVGDNPQSLKYVDLKQKNCQKIGLKCILHHLPSITPTPQIIALINTLNKDPEVSGFLVQLPLPVGANKNKILSSIDPRKDVDGLTTNSPFVPAVVSGVIHLLDEYKLNFNGKNAVIINDSNLIGIPLKKILEKRNVKVTICNEFTTNIAEISRGADLLVSATGKTGLISPEYIKPGAVVIDIGGGDVDFAVVAEKTSYITPTIGGVGPMTIASLIESLVNSPYANSTF
jgi:methylenetetrahydrofolate dehydrogenase (NADP+)/methenyltetrahydrofolate cyclohydrolase